MANQIWLVFALLSAVTAAFVAIFGKIGLKGVDANTATAIRAVVMAVFLIGVVLFQILLGKPNQTLSIIKNPDAITFIILSGVAGAASWLFYFLALKYGTVSQVAPIDRLSVVFAIILAVLFLGEKVSIQTAAGAVMIAVGAIMIAMG